MDFHLQDKDHGFSSLGRPRLNSNNRLQIHSRRPLGRLEHTLRPFSQPFPYHPEGLPGQEAGL